MRGKRAWGQWCTRHGDLLHGAFFFACFVVASVAGAQDMALLADNQHYFFIAERAASGIPPHVSHFDPKNALGMLITAAAIRAGSLAGVDELLASRIVSVIAGGLAVALIGPLTRRLTASTIAAWVASVAMFSSWRFVVMAAMGSQPKVFLVLFVVASLFLTSLRRWVLAGLAAGAAFLCWQPAAGLIVLGALALAVGGAGKRPVVSFLAASTAVIVVYEGYFLYHGALREQLSQAFLFPVQFMESPPTRLRPVLRRGAWALNVSRGLSLSSVVPLMFLAWLALLWTGRFRRWRDGAPGFAGRPDRIYVVLGAHAALANCLISYQGFPDRFFLDPFMAVTAGWVVAWSLARVEAGPRALSARRFVAAVSILTLCVLAAGGNWNFRYLGGLHQQRKLGEAVGRLLDGGFTVYAVGCTHLLAFNHADNFTPYGFFFRGVGESLQVRTSGRGYRPLRDGRMPDVILISRGNYIREQPWFEAEYTRANREDFGNQSVQVWLRTRRGSREVSRDTPAISAASP